MNGDTESRILSRVINWRWVSDHIHVATALFPRKSAPTRWIGVWVGFRCVWTCWGRAIFLFL